MFYDEGVIICFLPLRGKVFIKALEPRIFIEMKTSHSTNGRPLNPYLLGRHG